MSSNESYEIISLANRATKPLRLVNGQATLFAAGLPVGGVYTALPAAVALQIRPYFNFDGEPWPDNEAGWFTESTQTENGFSGTIELGGEWQVRAAVHGDWNIDMQAGVVLGTSVESK
jgi:hypothetical protein